MDSWANIAGSPRVIEQKDDLLFLYKPEGYACLKLESSELPNLESWLVESNITQAGALPDCGLLHRIDNETSGLVAAAKTQETFEYYRSIWGDPDLVKKIYLARVLLQEREEIEPRTQIDWPVGHSKKSSKRMIVRHPDRSTFFKKKIKGQAREAKTTIEKVTEIPNKEQLELEVRIHTGVRHQIRAHLAAYGVPILGDPIYGVQMANRMYLHSLKIELKSPNGKIIECEAATPETWSL